MVLDVTWPWFATLHTKIREDRAVGRDALCLEPASCSDHRESRGGACKQERWACISR